MRKKNLYHNRKRLLHHQLSFINFVCCVQYINIYIKSGDWLGQPKFFHIFRQIKSSVLTMYFVSFSCRMMKFLPIILDVFLCILADRMFCRLLNSFYCYHWWVSIKTSSVPETATQAQAMTLPFSMLSMYWIMSRSFFAPHFSFHGLSITFMKVNLGSRTFVGHLCISFWIPALPSDYYCWFVFFFLFFLSSYCMSFRFLLLKTSLKGRLWYLYPFPVEVGDVAAVFLHSSQNVSTYFINFCCFLWLAFLL